MPNFLPSSRLRAALLLLVLALGFQSLQPAGAHASTAAPDSFNIVATAGSEGLIIPSGTVRVPAGSNVTFTVFVGGCSNIAGVLVDGASVGPVTSYTFTNVSAAHTIAASFQALPPTSTALSTSAASGSCEAPETLRARVTNANEGQVRFFDGATLLGEASIIDSVATLTIFPLPLGTHSLSATYTGGLCNRPSTSASVVYSVTRPTATLVLSSSPSVVRGIAAATFTAEVRVGGSVSGYSSGTVNFFEGATPLGSAPVGAGVATKAIAFSTAGVHTVTAEYSGDACLLAATSNAVTTTVNPADAVLKIYVSQNPVTQVPPLTVSVMVLPDGVLATWPSGSVTLTVDGNPAGTQPIANGNAQFTLGALGAGSHVVGAQYAGAPLLSAGSASSTLLVSSVATTVVLTSPAPVVSGLTTSFVARVVPAPLSGFIIFSDDTGPFATVPLSGGRATANYLASAYGIRNVTASYTSDSLSQPATASLVQTFSPFTAPILTLTNTPIVPGSLSTNLRASFQPPAYVGVVTFRDASGPFWSASVEQLGYAEASYTAPSYGFHTIYADLSGEVHGFHPSDSLVLNFLGVTGRIPTTTSLVSSSNPGQGGTAVTLTATITPAAASGPVSFYDGTTLFATVNRLSGPATITYTLPQSGARTLVAKYAGSATHEPSQGTLVQSVVPRAASTIALTSSLTPELLGHQVTFTATITPATPGPIVFYDGPAQVGSVTATGGVASFAYTLPSPLGKHVITAQFNGDAQYLPASTTFDQFVVSRYPTTTTLSSSANPSTSRSVTLTATVLPATAPGSVHFVDDLGNEATVALVGGIATWSYEAPRFSGRTFTASYLGDASYATSQGTLAQQFTGTPTTTSLAVSTDPVPLHVSAVLTATVSPADASGSVVFTDGATVLGSGVLSGGIATITAVFTTPGLRILTANYEGDTVYSSSAGTLTISTGAAFTTTVVAASSRATGPGDWVRFTATVSPSPGSGSATFSVDGIPLGTASVVGNVATLDYSGLSAGTHQLTAQFSGFVPYAGSTSAPVPHYVVQPLANILHVDYPNGNEELVIGQETTILWNSVSYPGLARVNVYFAAVSKAPLWQVIASNVLNTGVLDWTVREPLRPVDQPTGPLTAWFAVMDLTGQIGSDQSDLPVKFLDLTTDAMVTQFAAEPEEDGIHLAWTLASSASEWHVNLERAEVESGPWARVDGEATETNGARTIVDREAVAGVSYWYRLAGTDQGGATVVFATTQATAGAPKFFALGAAYPNPTRGLTSLRFSVARDAHIRLALFDLQGREVAVLADERYRAGSYKLNWDGRGKSGAIPSGIYFLRYQTPDKAFIGRLAVMR